MSDVDRLRAAADYLAGLNEDDAPASHATAALLRAVADTYAPCGCDDEVVAAALALTDAILDDR